MKLLHLNYLRKRENNLFFPVVFRLRHNYWTCHEILAKEIQTAVEKT